MPTWKKRWFMLTGCHLAYFKDSSLVNELGRVHLLRIEKVRACRVLFVCMCLRSL